MDGVGRSIAILQKVEKLKSIADELYQAHSQNNIVHEYAQLCQEPTAEEA